MIICKRPVHLDDHLQEALDDLCYCCCFVVVVVESGEPGELDESGKSDEYCELGLKMKIAH